MSATSSRPPRERVPYLHSVFSIACGSGAAVATDPSDRGDSSRAEGVAPTYEWRGRTKGIKPQFGRLALVLGAALAMGGCTNPYEVFDPDFGSSVRHMIAMQTSNPNQAARGMDGEKAEAGLREYRKDVAKPKSVEKKVVELKL